MDNETVIIRLHHKGRFTRNKYLGGSHDTFEEDRDRFSFSVLMEFVKEMKYKEIGGLFVNKDGWKLLSDDRTLDAYTKGKSEVDVYIECNVDKSIPAMTQMQPHVVVRARTSPLLTKADQKRTFVTLQNINAEKKRKLKVKDDNKERINNTRKKLQFNNVDDEPPEGLLGLSDYLKRFETPPSKTKTAGGEKSEKNVEGEGCNDYEMRRNENVAKNKAKLKELGLVSEDPGKSCQKDKGKYKVTNDNASESEYLPNNNDIEAERRSEHEDDNVTSKRTKKVKRQRVEIGDGPRTRSRATKMPDSSQMKEPDAGATLPSVEVNKAPVVSLKEKLNNLRNGPGSMTAYLALREQEKLDLQKEIPRAESQNQHLQSQSVEKSVDVAPKRKRGKTKMNHVHNRVEKKRITLNYLNQPIADEGKLLAEFSNFIGTTVRQFVSLTCASWHQVPEKNLLWEYVKDKYIVPDDAKPWVNKTMSDQFRSTKSRIKRDYYSTRSTDEERLANKPEEVSLSDWKILVNYWGDEKVKEIAKKNSEARKKIIETHTTGSTSFAQVAHKLRLEKLEKLEKEKQEKLEQEKLGKTPVNDDGEGEGNDEEEEIKVSDADIYLATRKRNENREYKLPEVVLKTVNNKIVNVQKALETDGVEAANKLVRGDKEHNPSYLIGRLIRKKEPKSSKSSTSTVTSSIPDDQLAELTAKIRVQLQQEMDQKLDQKMREMMKMLAEKNPELKLDTAEKSVGTEKYGEVSSHGEDNDVGSD